MNNCIPKFCMHVISYPCPKFKSLILFKIHLAHINLLWLNHTMWHHRTWSTLVQVMACCLIAPNHYLNQCWLLNSEVSWQSPEGNFAGNSKDAYPWYESENYKFNICWEAQINCHVPKKTSPLKWWPIDFETENGLSGWHLCDSLINRLQCWASMTRGHKSKLLIFLTFF